MGLRDIIRNTANAYRLAADNQATAAASTAADALAAGADPVWGDALSGEDLSVTVRRLIDEGEYA